MMTARLEGNIDRRPAHIHTLLLGMMQRMRLRMGEARGLGVPLGQDIPNAVIAPLATNGDLCLTASTPTHLIIDLSAWFAAP